ncbi:MAG: YggT family protein [Coriobacteriales bacterium]|nr:YggT family protein [Coriobacteriales bacterium]
MYFSIVTFILGLVDVYVGIIVIYILMSWLPNKNGFILNLYKGLGFICEPYLGLFRKIIPPIGGGGFGLDISPIIAIIVLQLFARLIVRLF